MLTNVFGDRSTDIPAASVSYSVDGNSHEDEWPGEVNQVLSQIGFYDQDCGNAYISNESNVTYRPSALVLLDGLIAACDAVRDELDRLLAGNAQLRATLPKPQPGTAIQRFLDQLSARTTSEEIEAACSIPDDVDEEIVKLATEAARLQGSDPTRERARLVDVSTKLVAVANHLDSLASTLGADAEADFVTKQQRARDLRSAAQVASSASFDAEPVNGIGSGTWRALWEAARRYSETEAYPDHAFPNVTRDASCVLCQQVLSDEASNRFQRFHAFMTDDTERQAQIAQRDLDDGTQVLRSVEVEPTIITVALTTLEANFEDLVAQSRAAISAFGHRKTSLLGWLENPGADLPDVPNTTTDSDLRSAAEAATAQATTIDVSEFQRMVATIGSQRLELEGRRDATAARPAIEQEIARLRTRETLHDARRLTDTTGITRKSSDLARDHVTALVRDRFTRESHDLKLERITLQDTRGQKGQLMHRPAFLGASQDARITQVLSEGEQTALGLAGFITEAELDQTRSAIVLDDPVTSLDHIRRSHVATRLCKFAKDRQVIVFTHDVTFVGDLRKAAEIASVGFTERSVERRADGNIGVCTEQHPWRVRDAKTRLGQLEAELARIKREMSMWDSETYDKEAADWAGRLSETWERIINLEIVNRVVDRGTSEVRPQMFRMLAKITEQDDQEFQHSYSRCSQWARRHDKSPEIGYVPPDVAEMEKELAFARTWYERVRKYAN